VRHNNYVSRLTIIQICIFIYIHYRFNHGTYLHAYSSRKNEQWFRNKKKSNLCIGTCLLELGVATRLIVYKAIVWHNSDTIVNFEPKSNCQYQLSSSARSWQNAFQQGVDISRNTFLERWDGSLKTFDLIV